MSICQPTKLPEVETRLKLNCTQEKLSQSRLFWPCGKLLCSALPVNICQIMTKLMIILAFPIYKIKYLICLGLVLKVLLWKFKSKTMKRKSEDKC